jgi:hypothetical protein
MAQTANGISLKDAKTEFSTDGTNWVDISGWSSEFTIAGGKRKTAEANTFDGDTPIIGKGKRAAITATATIIYTEVTTDPFLTLLPYYLAGSAVALRASPRGLVGGLTGEYQYATTFAGSVLDELLPPAGKADAATPATAKISVTAAGYTTSTSAT